MMSTPIELTQPQGYKVSASVMKALTRLHPMERVYVTGMKRKERAEVASRIGKVVKTPQSEAPLRIQLLQSSPPDHTKSVIFEDLSRNVCEKYTTWVRRAIQLPIGHMYQQASTKDAYTTITDAKCLMDTLSTGHQSAKTEVLKLICQTLITGSVQSTYSIGLEGPPGTGKTHFVKHSLAPALNRPLICIPLGGANDVSYLLGSLYVYEGSKEGRLASALMEAGCCNPIIYFDEVDKVSATERGNEIIGVLIHLIDPTSNMQLQDRYFHGIDLDFSKCTFVFSYNDADKISPVLLDRIKRISMPSPTDSERREIICKHIIPRVQQRIGASLSLSNTTIDMILRRGNLSTGMRNMEKEVEHVLATAQLHQIIENGGKGVISSDSNICDQFVDSLLLPMEDDSFPVTMYN